MNKKKLNLNELKVKSFVTAQNEGQAETVKGGVEGSCIPNCGGGGTLPQSIYCVYTEVCTIEWERQ